jgi:uncharacterized protein YydD (DUF2326 family)
MRLISLTSNKESFKPVHFKNEIGLNFIVATQNNSEINLKDKDSTYNGVGKSLIIALIHFCLGSNKKDSFKNDLPDWSFKLTFKIENEPYVCERKTNNQGIIILNDKEITVAKFNKKFGDLLFEIPEEVSQLSFRSLMPFFIRPKKASYNYFNNPNAVKNDFQILITNSLLLGLNVLLVEEKFKLRKEKERIKNLVKELNDDVLLKEFFNQKKDAALEGQQVKEDISKLQNDLANFEVAEDYYEVNSEANLLKNELDKINNKIVLLQNQVRSIDDTRKITPDLKRENIESIYKEASIIIKNDALKTLSELESFYEHLSKSREKRLLDQKNTLQEEIKNLNKNIEVKSNDLDNKLKYLNAKQALDVFVNLNNKLSDLKSKEANIIKYNELIESYNKSKIQTEKSFIESTEKTNVYLDDAKELIKETTDYFRSLSKCFYPNSAAGITIYNNSGDNQKRFDIDAKIDADASDGINNIKLFCYDLTILIKGYSHKINFVFHDSRLLDGVDSRKTAELFKILDERIKKEKKQYILSLNQNQLDEIQKYLSPTEFKNIVTDNVCLELKDDSAESKLLGIQVNMDYN